MKYKYEIAIVGAGPAGLQAAIYCARARRSVVLFDKGWPTHLLKMRCENYLGFPAGIGGKEFLNAGLTQAKKFGTDFRQEEVVKIRKKQGAFIIETSKGGYSVPKLLIASGKAIKPILKNETKLVGKGVSYCVPCDGPLFKGKKVGVVGSGDLAASTASELLAYTKDITIFTNGKEPAFSKRFTNILRKVKINSKVIRELAGVAKLQGVVFNGKTEIIDGLFMASGFASSLDFARKLGLETKGIFLAVNKKMQTSIKEVWATGDCTGSPFQIAKAVGEGAIAALNMLGMEALY